MACTRALHVAARGLATASSSPAASGVLPHGDLAVRALLRNLKLLSGMRPKDNFSVLVAGYEAAITAERMRALEPRLRVAVVGDETGVDQGKLKDHEGADHDAAILLQPYHILRGGRWGGQSQTGPTTTEWAALRRCLHDEDGALGMLWTRAPPSQPSAWLEAFTAAAGPDLGASRGLLPALTRGQTPMAWVDGLGLGVDGGPGAGFRPPKHRKFIETVQQASVDAFTPLLRAVHDARFPPAVPGAPAPSSPQLEAAVAAGRAAAATGSPSSPLSLALDVHGFHSQVVPLKKKKKK